MLGSGVLYDLDQLVSEYALDLVGDWNSSTDTFRGVENDLLVT
jgi:hypothetical protein